MSKPVAFVVLLVCAVLTAGIFGMLHNQLSYSVGASYFHDFKFAQFGVDPAQHSRWGAALVGWQASWWMGLVIGVPIFGTGFVFIEKPGTFLAAGLGALMMVVIITLVAAMGGLLIGLLDIAGLASQLTLPDGITDRAGFLRAALMHEASYLGGLLGLVLGVWTMWRTGRFERRQKRERRHAA